MNNWQNSRHDAIKEEKPPHSRIFVVCDKHLRENDLRQAFEKFGEMEDLYMPKDRNTGASRGVAYIKFTKTSSAANAIREMHLKAAKNETKPMKVMIAANKNESLQSSSEDRYMRLFIKVSKEATETEIRNHFEQFGRVESVFLQKDKVTEENRGFAYVKYSSFVDAAKAFENCNNKYKPVFAVPREGLKRSRNSLEIHNLYSGNQDRYCDSGSHSRSNQEKRQEMCTHSRDDNNIQTLISTKPEAYKSVTVNCTPEVPQKHIIQLFNIIPGMVQCQYSVDKYNGFCKAIITYQEEKTAAYAVEKLNGFEFPSGELLSVKPYSNPLAKAANNLAQLITTLKNGIDANPDLTMLADAIAQASTLIKDAAIKSEYSEESVILNCSVDLPQPEPMANSNSDVAMRLFIVCKPQPPGLAVLNDVFCRFGNLIHIATYPNKTFGFVSYASTKSAQEAMRVLNGALVEGVRLKVMEAIEKPNTEEAFSVMNEGQIFERDDHDAVRKRIKLQEKL